MERASAGDRANEIVAQRILELAKSGERNPDRSVIFAWSSDSGHSAMSARCPVCPR
jgi:hypothetical protein